MKNATKVGIALWIALLALHITAQYNGWYFLAGVSFCALFMFPFSCLVIANEVKLRTWFQK